MRVLPLLALWLLPLLAVAAEPAPAPVDTAAKAELLRQIPAKWVISAPVAPGELTPAVAAPSLRDQLAATQLDSVAIVSTPLSAALDSLSQQAEFALNFVLPVGTDPLVTLNLRATTLAEALDLLLESAALSYEIRGNTFVVLPSGSGGALRTRSFPLSQSLLTRLVGAELAKATPATTGSSADTTPSPQPLYMRTGAEAALRGFFERLGIAWPEGSGMALADGELLVTHNARTLDQIEALIGRMARHRQVEIEARFMEVGEGALNELGIQWNASSANGRSSGGTTIAAGSSATTQNNIRSIAGAFAAPAALSGTATAPVIPGSVNLANSTTPTADITGVLGDYTLRGVLRALSQQDGTELLSAPRVTVLSGSSASITVAQEMRYPQSYDRVNTDVGSGTSSGSILTAPTPLDFTTRNVGVEMEVTPYVEDDGSITLILQPQVTQFERFVDYGGQSVVINGSVTQTLPSGFFQPIFSVRKLSTEVNIPSGSTVLMGGLTREESVKVKDKVPLLGDIPFLGRAFRSSGTSTLKKNLVIFVTAKLVE